MAEAADFQGMSASPARRWLRRTGALCAAAPLLAGLFQITPAVAQEAASAPTGTAPKGAAQKAEPTGSGTVSVSVDKLTPSAPGEGDTLSVSGTLTNQSRHTVTDGKLALRIGPSLSGRSAIDSAAEGHSFGTIPEGVEIGGKYAETFAKLPPGISRPFSLHVPVKQLHLGSDGVYQLGIALTGQSTVQPWSQVLGIERTFLPWQPDAADTKTKTAFLWPLISSTHLTAETGSDEQQTPVFHDDSLATEIAPGGRLQQMVSLGRDLDVTWVIDPDLLASVDAMTRNYRVEGPDDTTVPGRSQAVAKQWLNDLEGAVAGAKVVALPFGDPDIASLAHTGKNVSGSLGHLRDATEVASSTVETILHVKPDTDFAWPANGAVDPSIVDVATSGGADRVIARSDSFRETGNLPYTPSAARPIGGGTTAVVADERLSTAFQGDMTRAESSTLAVQEFLAQSLMIQQQAPHKQRSIVVAPQRMPTASQAQTMAAAVQDLASGNWSQLQDLTAAAAAEPDPGATTHVPSAHAYPASLHKQEIPEQGFKKIEETQGTLDGFKEILTDSSRVVTPFGRAIDREMSNSWRGRQTDAKAFRTGVDAYLDRLTKGVGLIPKSETKLSGRSATIPVTVQNNLVQGVDHLVLRLTSTKPTRLKIGDGPSSQQPVQVSGGHSQSVKFTTTANANGPVPVRAQLYTQDGHPYGDAVDFDVNVTEVTPAVMLVLAGGVLLLVLAGFRMYTQRKRAARNAPGGTEPQDTGAEARPDDAADAGDGPEKGPDDEPVTGENAPDHQEADADQTQADESRAEEDHSPAGDATDRAGEDGPEPGNEEEESAVRQRAADSQQPSDPVPDTAPESADVSGAGERVDR